MRWDLFIHHMIPQKGSTRYAIIEAPTYKLAWRLARKLCKELHTSSLRVERA
jgi:hypothetical protein